MKKRFMSCLLATAMVITSLTACGGGKSTTTDTTAAAGGETAETTAGETAGDTKAESGDRKKVVFWYSHKGDFVKQYTQKGKLLFTGRYDNK